MIKLCVTGATKRRINFLSLNMPTAALSKDLLTRILLKLGLPSADTASMEVLAQIYTAWCHRVPFDNVQKLIHVRGGHDTPLPGSTAQDFFHNWLDHGTGGTCWSGSNALAALLTSLGFNARREIGTMLAAPDLSPNHGTVVVSIGADEDYLVDTSILHHHPLRLHSGGITAIAHPAWGIQATRQQERWHLHWRPLHMTAGFVCRYEPVGEDHPDFEHRYDQTRGWSPFNYQLSARLNRGNEVIGFAFGNAVTLHEDGRVTSQPVTHRERTAFLVEEMGFSEEIAQRLPEDVPTPPPPGSRKAELHMA